MERPTPDGKDRRRDRWGRALLLGLAGALVYALSQALPLFPSVAERVLGDGRGALPARLMSGVTGRLPFSVGEVLIGLYALSTLRLAVRAARQIRRRERTLADALGGGTARLLSHVGVAVVVFYAVWGFSYASPSLAERGGWPEWSEPSRAELTDLTRASVQNANDAYRALHGSLDRGSPTPFPSDVAALESAVQHGSTLALSFLPPNQSQGRGMPSARVKRPWSSGVLARLGMSGVFFPLTAETHVIRGLPAASSVQSYAHERAHLWGFANEAEASYAGYLANALAADPLPRYAAALFAANQLLRALRRVDRLGAQQIRAQLSAGIQRDLTAINDFWRPYRGVGHRFGSALNDRYLRANRVPGGVGSYGRSSRLLVEFARQNGALVPIAEATPR